jgi:hypothetical protein
VRKTRNKKSYNCIGSTLLTQFLKLDNPFLMKTKTSLIAFFFLFKCLLGFSQNNTATGTGAGLSGTQNSSFGYFAGNKVTGSENTFLGIQAGRENTSGNYNTFLGSNAGRNNISGSFNTSLGYRAGYGAIGSNNIFIGSQAGHGETGSNKLYIEATPFITNQSNPLIYGDFGSRQVSINGKPADSYTTFTVNGNIIGTNNISVQTLSAKYSIMFDHQIPTIYLGISDGADLNRYLHIVNSEDTEHIPSGLKAGGILVADDYNFAYPSKNDIVAARSLHIGKYVTTPQGEDPRDYPHTPLYVYNSNSYNHNAAVFEHGFNTNTNIIVQNTLGQLLLGVDSQGKSQITPTTGKLGIGGIVNVDIDKVGIGTTVPDGFQVNVPLANENTQPTSNIRIGVLGSTPRIILDKAGSVPFEIDNAGGQLRIFNPGAVRLVVNSNGFVGIGTGSPDEALTVKGKIHTNEVKVDLLGAVAPDYVFEPTYDLKPLAEIETYIKENKHLPEVPSAKEMEQNGVQLGEMNMLLLKKVEELTLHLIELKKENDSLKVRVEKMEVKK